jgi:site-specific recombinase XerD
MRTTNNEAAIEVLVKELVIAINANADRERAHAGALVRAYAAHRAKVRTGVHILRHTFCSHLVMRGAGMRAVQELVGHQDLTMTQRYAHLSQAALGDTIRLLERRDAALQGGDNVETAEGRLGKVNG